MPPTDYRYPYMSRDGEEAGPVPVDEGAPAADAFEPRGAAGSRRFPARCS